MSHAHPQKQPTLESLVARWADVVTEIERGYRLTFDDYLNDVDLRQLIERRLRALSASSHELVAPLRAQLKAIDDRFLASTDPVDECVWGEANAQDEGWSRDREWWYYRQPAKRSEDW